MALSNQLISQFAKQVNANNSKKVPIETTVYGKVKYYNGREYVQIDGSDLLTPVETTTSVKDGDRVTVSIKNHTATITGNLTDPSASSKTVSAMGKQISEFGTIVAHRVVAEELEVTNSYIDNLKAITGKFEEMSALTAEIEELQAGLVNAEYLSATDIEAINAELENIRAEFGSFTGVTTQDIDAFNANITNLEAYVGDFTYVSTDFLEAVRADVKRLDVDKLSSESADITYAKIDFSNIGEATMEYFYAKSGLIESVTVSEGTITGILVGVTIKGDLIEANTVVADKLVVLGEDGLYYKLNTDGMTVEAEQTEYNSLNGKIITAKSVTAEKISVDDLVAFDATIGGFNITDSAIFSDIKDSEGNSIRGIYLGKDGTFDFGDGDNFIRYYKNDAGEWHLAISADTILYNVNGKQKSIADLGLIGEYVQISTYEGEPCIELGESDSDFKLIITNTRIMFMEGTGVPAYINNQSLFIKKAVIEEELQQGGFVWKVRSNGNLGLVWKGVSN